jgi:hypothetical protein
MDFLKNGCDTTLQEDWQIHIARTFPGKVDALLCWRTVSSSDLQRPRRPSTRPSGKGITASQCDLTFITVAGSVMP